MKNIDSPCIRNCCLDESDICLGCFRSLDEILQWGSATPEQRITVLSNANDRKIKHDLKYKDGK